MDDADTVVVVGVAPRPEHHGAEAQRGRTPHAGPTEGAEVHCLPFVQCWCDSFGVLQCAAVCWPRGRCGRYGAQIDRGWSGGPVDAGAEAAVTSASGSP